MTAEQAFDISQLNAEQQRAVKTVNGRVLVLAGAGTGKTRVLTYRMAHLVENLGVPPEAILAVTFTNKAAAEMRQRMSEILGAERAKSLTLCTFHSFCMQVLRQDIERLGFNKRFTLYDEHDVTRLLKLIAREELAHEGDLPSLSGTIQAISQAKSRGVGADSLEVTGHDWLDKFNSRAFERLENSMRAYNALDFDSLLTLTVRLFREHPDVLARYNGRYRYIMIDEYQDTNPIQYQLASLLSASSGNLCVVGDDDQSIYGWRGADVRNILDFGDATVVKLEQNYRSTNTVLRSANAVIQKNPDRFEKALWSQRGEGQQIEVFVAPDDVREAEAVVHRLVSLKQRAGLRWKDIAILYRSNALSRLVEKALMAYSWSDGRRWVQGVPYQIYGGTAFYDRKEVKDLIGYLRVLINPRDQEAILRVINQPRRGIGEGALEHLRTFAKLKGCTLWTALQETDGALQSELSSRARNGVDRFVAAIKEARQNFESQPLAEAMRTLIERIDFQKAIAEDVKSEKMRAFKWENVQELVSALHEFEVQCQIDDSKPKLEDFMSSTTLQRDDRERKKDGMSLDAVNLMTIHSSKGLEFPACFLIGLEENIIPHSRSLKEGSIAEERRLMYVAITRARDYLTCSMSATRKQMGRSGNSQPSRFMHDIPKEHLKVRKWDADS